MRIHKMANAPLHVLDSKLPVSRAQARAAGIKHYYTGKPCVNGHLDVRTATGGLCLQCARDRQKSRRQEPDYRESHRKNNLRLRMAKLQDPAERKRIRNLEQVASRSASRVAKKAEADRIRNQRPEVIEARRERQRKLYQERKDALRADPAYRAASNSRTAKWRASNRPFVNSMTAARRALLMKRLPGWLTQDDHECIRLMYAVAARVTRETGVSHELDHCIPLKGKTVSGLHVPSNLQLMSATANKSKGNKFLEMH